MALSLHLMKHSRACFMLMTMVCYMFLYTMPISILEKSAVIFNEMLPEHRVEYLLVSIVTYHAYVNSVTICKL